MLVYCDNINDLSDYEYELFLALLPTHRRNKALRYIRVKDRISSVVSYMLLIYMLNMMGMYDECLDIYTNRYGKPYLKNSEFEFNLSHTNNAVACVLQNESVGVDIQETVVEFDNIMDHVCTPSEIRLVRLSDMQAEYFTKLWTLKESYVKCIGTGVWDSINKVDFSYFEGEMRKMYGYYFYHIKENDYSISVCSVEIIKKVRKIDLEELLDFARSQANG